MNLGSKRDLDALLKDWPARPPTWGEASEQDDERRWDERADVIAKAAQDERNEMAAPEAGLDALLAAPALAPEPGESGVVLLSGKKEMTEEKPAGDHGAPALGETPNPPVSMGDIPNPPSVSPPAERKRTSLKEIAARGSQAGARVSSPSTPAPPSVAPGRPSSPGIAATVARSGLSGLSTVTPLPRPAEGGKEDSGVINLKVVQASATPQQVAAAAAAVPGQQGLFDDDKTVESAASPGQQPALARPTQIAVVSAKKSNAGPIAGLAIAALGIAAAFAIVMKKPPAQAPTAEVAPTVMVAPPPKVAAAPQPSTEATAATSVASADPTPAPSSEPRAAEPGRLAIAPLGAGAAPKDAVVDPRLASKGAPVPTGAPVPAGAPGDLQSEMARAAGASKDGEKGGQAVAVPEPAAGGPRNQNIPEQPSQGSVQAAVLSVMGGAKGCVAGADEISHAQITFSAAGNVSSVSVTGWAAAHGKSGCVQAALKAARVGPFSKPSFSVGVPIRP